LQPGRPAGVAMALELADSLMQEHRRLDLLVGQLESRVNAGINTGLMGLARGLYDELRRTLERHLDFEEKVVFPEFERLDAHGMELTAGLRSERAVLRRLLVDLGFELAGGEMINALASLADMREVMGPHLAVEERVVFPALAGTRTAARERPTGT